MIDCKSCGAPITWAKHNVTGKVMPLQVDPNGEWLIVGGLARRAGLPLPEGTGASLTLYSSHFATCPQASSWRSSR